MLKLSLSLFSMQTQAGPWPLHPGAAVTVARPAAVGGGPGL